MEYRYRTKDTCAREIVFEIEDGKIYNVKFIGGCDGNHKGIAHLVEGMDAEEVAQRLDGIHCGFRATSCPDQLSKAIRTYLKSE